MQNTQTPNGTLSGVLLLSKCDGTAEEVLCQEVVCAAFLTGPLTYRESDVFVVNSAMAGAVFSNRFTVSALCFIISTSPV